MQTATLRRPPSLPLAVQLGLIALLFALAAVAWAVTDDRMGGMDAGPGTDPGTLGFFVGAWVVMLAAMMFPSIAPMVLMHARVQAAKGERDRTAAAGATAMFVTGYLIVWAVAGLVGYAIVQGGEALSVDALAWDEGGPYLAGGVIVAAAAYQLTPLKDVCLTKCRNPLSFVMGHWHPGRIGALRMGIEHGGWCVGCCVALMAVMFALGVMSVGWMAFVAALIAVEKLLPYRRVANLGIAVLLVALGLGVALAPEHVPGLTVPGSPEAMEAMGMEPDGGMPPEMDSR